MVLTIINFFSVKENLVSVEKIGIFGIFLQIFAQLNLLTEVCF